MDINYKILGRMKAPQWEGNIRRTLVVGDDDGYSKNSNSLTKFIGQAIVLFRAMLQKV